MRQAKLLRLCAAAVIGAVLGALTPSVAAAETPIERGAYLVTTVGSCGNCHSPRDANGKIAAARELSGGFEFDDDVGHVISPNITPDPQTGIGKWSEAQIVMALRDGKRPDGSIIGPPMPIPVYEKLSDADADAIAAYLHHLKPVSHAVARTQYKIPLPPSYGPPVTHVVAPPRTEKIAYGGYLATFAHCVLCHTPPAKDGPFDMSRAFVGGRDLPDLSHPGRTTVSRNITADPEHGIGKWSDADIKRTIVTGVRPDGTKLSRTMPFDWYARMTPQDLDAIVAYMRTVKPAQ